MNKKINIIKLIILMSIIIVLNQLPCVAALEYFKFIYLPLTLFIWILGIKNIKKDTNFKKLIFYTFVIMWCIILFILSLVNGSRFSQSLCRLSPIIIFLISKILTIKQVKNKIEESNKYLIIICTVLFLVGYIISYYLHSYFMLKNYYNLICDLIICSINVIEIFIFLNIKLEKKLFIFISGIITIIFILIINITAMNKIKKIIIFQEELCDMINNNSLTYKNISTELESFIDGEIKESSNVVNIMDYQSCIYHNRKFLSIINSKINETNKNSFKNKMEELQDVAYSISEWINVGEDRYKNRVIVIVSSIIMVIGTSAIIINKKDDYRNIF